ncbi:lysophospholipase L1-like esterase [Neolewinella xylanilytica]|uniref:Lysophospholipase L1-like esterase n=1 Tax=Neolewinella xylanilytica TaxID=1514080 RepID=A0A2S6I041_9BACT|nr:SGNH/GDSL hydrolase family protein [Neolewinella xylanilytica]PPK84232.1 lysophospholipase L1-like esterase [Neolewinella xylanilytica]
MRILLFFCCVLCFACDNEDNDFQPPSLPDSTVESDTTLSFLALGDSYTIGTSVEAEQRWPDQLATALLEQESIRLLPLEIVARNGWRTDNLANALLADPPGNDWNMVSLLIGVNDLYQGFAVEGYETRFSALLESAIGFAGGDTASVFVLSIPDYAYTPFGGGNEAISKEIDRFNAAATRIAAEKGVMFYDITDISRKGLAEPLLVAEDNLHPSGLQYGRWVESVLLDRVAERVRARD